ncbi:hypothetical protein [Mycobacterium sp. MMS18-G62]
MAVIGAIIGFGLALDSTPQSDPPVGVNGQCPTASDVEANAVVTVSEKDGMPRIETTLDVKARGVVPPEPSWNIADLNNSGGSNSLGEGFSRCFLHNYPSIERVSWANGSLDARFKLATTYSYTVRPDKQLYAKDAHNLFDRENLPVIAHIPLFNNADLPSGQLAVAFCARNRQPDPPRLYGWSMAAVHTNIRRQVDVLDDQTDLGLLCSRQSKLTVTVQADSFNDPRMIAGEHGEVTAEDRAPSPFPEQASQDNDAAKYTWSFSGDKIPHITVPLAVPLRVSLAGYIDTFYNQPRASMLFADQTSEGFQIGSLKIDGRYWTYGLSALLCLVAAGLVIRRSARTARIFLILLGMILLGGVFLEYEPVSSGLSSSIFYIAGLTVIVIAVATASRKAIVQPLIWLLAAAVPVVVFAAVLYTRRIAVIGDPSSDADLVIPSAYNNVVVICFWVLMGLLGVSAVLLFIHLRRLFDLRHDTSDSDFQFRNTIALISAFALMGSLFYPVGLAVGDNYPIDPLSHDALYWLTWSVVRWKFTVLPLVPLIAATFIAMDLFIGRKSSQTKIPRVAVASSLMLTLCAPWTEGGAAHFIIDLPLWLVQWLILWLVFRHWLANGSDPDDGGEHPDTPRGVVPQGGSLVAATHGQAMTKTDADVLTADPEEDLLKPVGTIIDIARASARTAGILATVPVAIFVWSTLGDLSGKLVSADGALTVFVAIFVESARWVVGGFIFGLTFLRLPGHIGPVRGLAFAGVWTASSFVPVAIARGMDVDLGHQLIYRGAQFALFFVILGVITDLDALKARQGGSLTERLESLKDLYSLSSPTRTLVTLAPAAGLVLTLAQQILTGAPLDVANSFLGSVGSVITPPGSR